MYDTLIRYFKTLAHTGYKSYDVVFKMLVMDFIYEITHTELRYYITNKDIKLMQDLLYQFFGSTCEISFPTNNIHCCVCCNEGSSTPPPIVVPTTTTTTTTTTPPPIISSTTTTTSTPTPGITTTTTTTTTSTPPPSDKTGTLLFKAVAGWPYTVYYNRDFMTHVDETDISSTIPIPSSTTSVYYSIESIVWDTSHDASEVRIDGGVTSIPYIGELQPDSTVTIEPVVPLTSTTTTSTPVPSATTTTSTTTTSTPPPVVSNDETTIV